MLWTHNTRHSSTEPISAPGVLWSCRPLCYVCVLKTNSSWTINIWFAPTTTLKYKIKIFQGCQKYLRVFHRWHLRRWGRCSRGRSWCWRGCRGCWARLRLCPEAARRRSAAPPGHHNYYLLFLLSIIYYIYYLLSTVFIIYYLPVPPPAATWRPRAAGGGAACPGPALTNQSECWGHVTSLHQSQLTWPLPVVGEHAERQGDAGHHCRANINV